MANDPVTFTKITRAQAKKMDTTKGLLDLNPIDLDKLWDESPPPVQKLNLIDQFIRRGEAAERK